MTDWPGSGATPWTVWTGSRFGMGNVRALHGGSAGPTSLAWGTANLAIYVPMYIPFRYPVKNMFVYNFATVNGNHDVGIYTADLVKIASSGSTAQAGATGLQFMAVDILLDPGVYYFALSSNSTTATYACYQNPTATRLRYTGLFQQASAFALPATATIAAIASARLPLIGATKISGTPPF